MWRPGSIAKARSFVLSREIKQSFERSWGCVDGCVGIAELSKALRHGQNCKVCRIGVGNLLPVKRCRDARIRKRANGVSGGRGAVFRVLVVVQKDAMALFLPPL